MCRDVSTAAREWIYTSTMFNKLSLGLSALPSLWFLLRSCFLLVFLAHQVDLGIVFGRWLSAHFGYAAQTAQLVNLLFEGLAEDVVDEGVVYGGGLGEQTRQHADLRRDGVAGPVDGPQAGDSVGRPRGDEAGADQHGDLSERTVSYGFIFQRVCICIHTFIRSIFISMCVLDVIGVNMKKADIRYYPSEKHSLFFMARA